MASNLRVDTILPSSGTTLGIGTASGTINFLGNSNIVTSGTLTAASASITGNLGVGGVLTYEDVTNIDSVGVITARSGIRIGATGANTLITGNGTGIGIGITTPTEELHIRAATPVIRLEDGDNARQSQIVGSDGNLRFDADNGNAIADTNIAFRTDGVERLRISSQGYVTKPQTPFFSAYGSASNQTYNQGDIITFENVVQNVGNHFKMTSGTGQYQRFIAPVAGVYLFTFAFFPNTASACRIGLRVSTGLQTTPYISGCFTSWGTGSPVPSASQMLLLGADAYVDVVVANGTLTNTYDGHTTFQGILLG